MADNKAIAYLSVNDTEVKSKLDGFKNQLNTVNSTIKGVGESVLGLAKSVIAFEILSSSVEKLKASFDFADSLNDLSEQFGIAVKELSELDGLAKLNGTSFETLQKVYSKLSENISDANAGSEDAIKKFKALGISVKDTEGKIKSTSDVFLEIADVFKNAEADPTKMATALDLLGKAGRELIPLLNKGKDGIEEIKRELNDLGLVIRDEVSGSIAPLGDSFDKLALKSKASFANLAATFAPALSSLIELGLKEFKINLSDEEFKQKLQDTQDKIGSFISSVLETFDKLSPSITATIDFISSIFETFKETSINTFTKVMEIFGFVSEKGETDFNKINDIVTTTALTFKILVTAITSVAQAVIEIISRMAKNVIDIFSGLGSSISSFGSSLSNLASGEFKNAGKDFLGGFAEIGKTGNKVIKDIFSGTGESIANVVVKVKQQFDNIDNDLKRLNEKQLKNATNYKKSFDEIFNKQKDDIRNPKEKTGLRSINPVDKSKGEDTAKAQLEAYLKMQENYINQENDLYANRVKVLDLYRQKDKINADDYIEAKRNSDEELYKNTLDALNKEKSLLEKSLSSGGKERDMVKNREKLDEITKKISKTSSDYYMKEFENSIKFQDEKDKDAKKLDNILKRIYELQGQDGSVIDIELKAKLDDISKLENIIGKDNVEKLSSLEINTSNLNKVKKDLDEYKNSISIAEDEINIKRDAGYISELESLSNIRDIRSKNIDQLKEYKAELEKIALLDPNNKKLQDDIKKTSNEILKLETTLDPLAKKFDDIFSDSFSTFFSDITSGTKSVKEAFNDMTKSIFNSLNKLMMDDLTKKFYGLLTGGQQGGSSLGSMFSSLFNNSSSSSSSLSSSIGSAVSSIGSSIGSLFSGFGFADGGIPPINKLSVVGENGPELFMPGTTGTILNNDVTSRLASGGSTNVYVTIQATDVNSFRNSEMQIASTFNNILNKSRRNM